MLNKTDAKISFSEIFRSLTALTAVLFVFYPSFFLVTGAPLTGDHWEQHYPWAYLLSQSIKHGALPFWTSFLHAGFPIAAESQIGVFYLPNLLLYYFLPFHTAYSYMSLFHFLLGGIGTYLYGRKIGLKGEGAFMAACLFLFGGAFGGAYYNMTSLKTISWFPSVLYAFECLYQNKNRTAVLWIGFAIGMSLIAGYLQMALFTWAVFAIYAGMRLLRPEPSKTWGERFFILFWLSAALVLALFIALPQTYLTYLLSMESNRVGLQEDYAYVGSLSPFAWVTLFDPAAQYVFRGNNLYMGLFSLFLIGYAWTSPETRGKLPARLWAWMGVFCALLALGRWSPLYVALVKVTQFYSFRVPAKFIGFICFALSMIAGAGFQALFEDLKIKKEHLGLKAASLYLSFFSLFLLCTAGVYLLANFGQPWLMKAGEWYVQHFIYGKAGHPRTLESYLGDLPGHLQVLSSLYSLSSFENTRTFGLLFIGLILVLWIKKNQLTPRLLAVCLLFLSVDLYSYAWLDVKQDFATYKSKLESPSPVKDILVQEMKKGNMRRLYGSRRQGEMLPLVPSSNILYGIEDIGGYSPLVMKRYYETIGQFGNLNDSLRAASPDEKFVIDRLPLLKFLNVSHILSTQPLKHPSLKELFSSKEQGYLYANRYLGNAAYFIAQYQIMPDWESLKAKLMEPGFDPSQELLIEKNEIGRIGDALPAEPAAGLNSGLKLLTHSDDNLFCQIAAPAAGFVVLPNSFFRGWRVYVNDRESPLLRAYGVFQAVYLPNAGNYQIRFVYEPFSSLRRKQ